MTEELLFLYQCLDAIAALLNYLKNLFYFVIYILVVSGSPLTTPYNLKNKESKKYQYSHCSVQVL